MDLLKPVRGTLMKLTPVGIDIAKNIMKVHYVDENTCEIVNRSVKRAKFLQHFANRAPCLVGMEDCGGAHHRARQRQIDAGRVCEGF